MTIEEFMQCEDGEAPQLPKRCSSGDETCTSAQSLCKRDQQEDESRMKEVTSHEMRSNPMNISPRWGDHDDLPEHVCIDCSNYDMHDIDEEVFARAEKIFRDHGAIYLKNTGLTVLSEMEQWASKIMKGGREYKSGANSRRAISTEIVKNVYDTGAPGTADLHYHHEMAYVPISVSMLGFCAIKATPDPRKGATWISDQTAGTKWMLSRPLGQKLKDKGLTYVRCLTNKKAYEGVEKTWNGVDEIGVYNHWQQSFGVETREECEVELKKLGPMFTWTWGVDDYLVTKFHVAAFEKLDYDGMNYLYASVADDCLWFDSWEGVKQLPCMDDPDEANPSQRPLKLTFGDGEEFTRQELFEFVECYDRFGYPINWKVGEIAVICNWRWAHGRPAFHLVEGEERELGVILGPSFDRQGQTGDWMEAMTDDGSGSDSPFA